MSRRRLLAERDVQHAAREGATSIDARGATITPSALDLAARLGIALDRGEETTARPRAGTTPNARRGGTSASPAPTAAVSEEGGDAGPGARLRLALGADHGGVAMKDALRAWLTERGHQVVDLGTTGSGAVDYPDFAIAVARTVADGGADLGIMVDGAGIGSCMAANKVAGVRAAMCHDVTTAANAREHNHANVLTLGGTLLGQRLAQEIVHTFLQTPFGGGRHAARVGKIDALDAMRRG